MNVAFLSASVLLLACAACGPDVDGAFSGAAGVGGGVGGSASPASGPGPGGASSSKSASSGAVTSSGSTGGAGPTTTSTGPGPGPGSGGGRPCAHDPCVAGDALDASCSPCVAQQCQKDSFCCDATWDEYCAYQAADACGCSGTGGGSPCATCSEYASGGSTDPLCPASVVIFQSYYQCACANECALECIAPCNGGSDNPTCDSCVTSNCSAELNACFND